MSRFLLGLLTGIVVASSVPALAARLVGSDGVLAGWTVLVDGDEVCTDPSVSVSTMEIECD